LTTDNWIKKPKDLKRNGGLGKEYIIVNKNNFTEVILNHLTRHLYDITVTFKGLDFYELNLLIWGDEMHNLRKLLPFGIKIEDITSTKKEYTIIVVELSKDLKEAYIQLDKTNFLLYVKNLLKGY